MVLTMFSVTRVAPETDQLAHAASLLAVAQRPVIIIGDGVIAAGAQAELTHVAEQLGAEVWGTESSEVHMDTMLSKDLPGHMHKFNIFSAHSQITISQADVVLICGTYVFPAVFPALSHGCAFSANIIHIDLNSYEVGKNVPITFGLSSNLRTTLARLTAMLDTVMTTKQKAYAAIRTNQHTTFKGQELAAFQALIGDQPFLIDLLLTNEHSTHPA